MDTGRLTKNEEVWLVHYSLYALEFAQWVTVCKGH
jgi:hypothetical protein